MINTLCTTAIEVTKEGGSGPPKAQSFSIMEQFGIPDMSSSGYVLHAHLRSQLQYQCRRLDQQETIERECPPTDEDAMSADIEMEASLSIKV